MVMNIYLPSLPAMADHFQTSYPVVQLSVALYLGTTAVLQLVIGPVSDRLGRRPVVLWSCVLFCLSSLGCIYAPTVEVFLLFRMAQGVIVSAMVLGRAIIRDMFTTNEAASMIGYVTMCMAVVPMFSPALGGVLEYSFGWQGSFWTLAVIGGALWLLCWADLGETHVSRLASAGAQVREYRDLVRSGRFWAYAATAAFSAGAFFAYLGGAAYVGSTIFGIGAADLGLYLGSPAVGYMIGNGVSGRYSARFGIDRMVLCGALICAGGLATMALGFALGMGSALLFFGQMVWVGLGNGMVLPNATAGMLSVRPKLAGTASGLGGALTIGGGAILSALASVTSGALGQTAMPLVLVMLGSSLAGLVAIALTPSE